MPRSVGQKHGRDQAGGRGGEDKVAVHLTPSITARRLAQMMGAIIHLHAAIPVVMSDMAALAPVGMAGAMHRHRRCMIVAMIVMARLGERWTGHAGNQSQGSDGGEKAFHGNILSG